MELEGEVSYGIRIKEGYIEFTIHREDGVVAVGKMSKVDAIQLAKNISNTLGSR